MAMLNNQRVYIIYIYYTHVDKYGNLQQPEMASLANHQHGDFLEKCGLNHQKRLKLKTVDLNLRPTGQREVKQQT